MNFIRNASITTIGVYEYTLPDGGARKELRAPEDVFDRESIASLNLAPVTLNHPTAEEVTTGKFTVVGAVAIPFGENSEKWSTDPQMTDVVGDIAIYDLTLEKEKIAGMGISAGYTCDVVLEPGIWCGVQYDAWQKNIRYNHVALVENARAGDNTQLKEVRMDSRNGEIVTSIPSTVKAEEKPTTTQAEVKMDSAATAATPAPTVEAKTEAVVAPEVKAEVKADAAPAKAETPTEIKPEVKTEEVKFDAADFVRKSELTDIITKAVASGVAEVLKGVPKADAAEAPRPVVELKMDSKDEDPRKLFERNFFNQGGK